MRVATLVLATVGMALSGCGHRASVSVVHGDSLQSSIGQHISLVGVAEPRKLGAALRGQDFYVWIDGLQDWPIDYVDHRVQVAGVLEERHDLPVFIQKPGELPVQGIPVPDGTDLHEASRRYVVRDARWSLVR
jgi:hypothetical protein